MHTRDTNDEAIQAADAVRGLLLQLHDDGRGLPWSAVLAGAHAEIVAAMTATYGAEMTIARMVNAADRIEGIPSAAEVHLLARETTGHA